MGKWACALSVHVNHKGTNMSTAISIALTLVLLAIFIVCLVKNVKPTIIVLMLTALLGAILFTVFSGGQSLLGDKGTGNAFLDCFELFQSTFTKQMSGALLTILAVLGYVGYMNKIGASDRFALICAKPFTKLKNPYILCSGVILLVFILKLCIPSATSLAALMLATMYPVLRAAGCSALTSGSCIMIATGFIWGPADTMTAQIFSVSGIQAMTVPEFFAAYHVPTMAVMVPFAMIAFPIYSMICDKRAAKKGLTVEGNASTDVEIAVPDCPAYYALFPIFPLVFVVVFSKLVLGTIVLSVIGAVFVSIILTMIIDLIHAKSFKACFENANNFFLAMADFMRNGGWLIIPAAMFATVLSAMGGLQAIAQLLSNAGGNGYLICAVGCVLCMPIIICCGSVTATIAIAAPLMTSIAAVTGMDVNVCFMAVLVMLGVSSCMCPVHPQTIMVSTAAGVDLMTLIKRNAPIACMVIAAGIIGCFILC